MVLTSAWYKSPRSAQDNCVEVSLDRITATVKVRDSKDPHGPVLTFPIADWNAFLTSVKADQHPSC